MGWEHRMASKIKSQGKEARHKAARDASAYIGTIEQTNPLIVSIVNGAAMFRQEDDEIIQSKAFKTRAASTKAVGTQVIAVPVGGLEVIAIIDVVEGG